jgi:hypothetical protein
MQYPNASVLTHLNAQAGVAERLRESGFAVLGPGEFTALHRLSLADLEFLRSAWSALPPDAWLRDGGRYRFRRHSCFVHDLSDGSLQITPHRAHWQPTDYNALHGGLERWFEPVEAWVSEAAVWRALLCALGEQFGRVKPVDRWCIEAHQFRIDAASGIGRPTPEGAHRDGVDFVAVILIQRRSIRGGETRVFDADGPAGVRFTMTEPWTALLLDDARVIHETTPIQSDGDQPVRDTLVLTYRSGGFQAKDAS